MSCAIFDKLVCCQNTKNKWKYKAILPTQTANKLFIIQLLFFCKVFLIISQFKCIFKCDLSSQPDRQVLLQYKLTNCTILHDICILFMHYLHSTLCSWIINTGKVYSWSEVWFSSDFKRQLLNVWPGMFMNNTKKRVLYDYNFYDSKNSICTVLSHHWSPELSCSAQSWRIQIYFPWQ